MPAVRDIQRRGRALLVEFDDGSALECDRDFLPGQRLAAGQEIEAAILARLRQRAAGHEAERLVLRWIALKPRSRADLLRRLRGKGVDREIAQETLDHLAEQGFLDDHAFAQAWVESRLRFRPRASRMIRSELQAQGVNGAIADELTREIDDDATALAIAVDLRARFPAASAEHPDEGWEQFRHKTGGLLQRRGFGHEAAERAMRAAWAPPAPARR